MEVDMDYKAMFEAMAKKVQDLLKADEEYFSLISLISEQSKYTTAVNENLLRIPKNDQIMMMRALSKVGAIAESICNKYNLLTETEDADEEA